MGGISVRRLRLHRVHVAGERENPPRTRPDRALQVCRYEDPEQEQLRKETVEAQVEADGSPIPETALPDEAQVEGDGTAIPETALPDEDSFNRIVGLRLLGYERDQIARRILAEHAAGFSHGFSLFGD